MHPCGAWHHWTRLPDSAFAKTLGGHELCPTLDQHLKANKLAGEASTVLHLTPTPYSVPPSLLHHVPRFPFARCAGLLHLLILLPTQHVQSSRDASTTILISSICNCFFNCPHHPLQFYMLTSDTSIRACLTICQLSSSKTPHGVHGRSPKRLPYAFACSISLQCVAATGHQMIDLARRQLSHGDSFLSKSPTPIMRRRASTSRGPPPSWFTRSPCAACRWCSEVPGDPLDCKRRQCLTNKIAEMVDHQTCVPVILLTIPLIQTFLPWHSGLVHSPGQEGDHLHSQIVTVVNMSTEER